MQKLSAKWLITTNIFIYNCALCVVYRYYLRHCVSRAEGSEREGDRQRERKILRTLL